VNLCYPCWRREAQARPGPKSERIAKTCPTCGWVFYVTRYYAQRRRYCSRSCYGQAQRRRVTQTCESCGVAFEVIPSYAGKRRYCDQCHRAARHTERQPNARLRAARERAGLTQTALAAQVGVDVKTANRWETQGRIPSSPETRAAVAEVLGCDPWAEDDRQVRE